VLAPLAGITDAPFRQVIREMDCGLVYTEMISANALVQGSPRTLRMMDSVPGGVPLSVQIFGADPAIMAEAARIVTAAGSRVLDINFGCAVRKIVKTGAGVALMGDPWKADRVLRAVRRATSIPLTIKIRSGWQPDGKQALETVAIAEANGVDAVAVHPRTARQGFSGRADWKLIATVKKRTPLPVIGNGDIVTPQDALAMMAQTGCDGVMIGRGAVKNPWIFAQVKALLKGRRPLVVETIMRRDLMLGYVRASVAHYGEAIACRQFRSRLGWFVKGLHHSSRFRASLSHLETEREAVALISDFFHTLPAPRSPSPEV
jgi:nifR3 family TIM-barrel protein